MDTFDNIQGFNELAKGFIRNVAEERDRAPAIALLKRLERISAPNAGAPKILLLLCAIARFSRWLPGQMRVELVRDAERTVVDIQMDEGGIRERLCGKLSLSAPLDEFVETVRKLDAHPETPLNVTSYRRKDDVLTAIELTMAVAVRPLTMPPPEMAERVKRAAITRVVAAPPPKPIRRKKGVTPSVLPVVLPNAPPSDTAAPISRRADTRKIDDEWG